MAVKKVDLRSKDYHRCQCCTLIQHEYQFPYIDKTKTARAFAKCLGCKRENCYSTTSCKLGQTHDN